MHVTVAYSLWLMKISEVIGWGYFIAWSISFYPQIYINFQRKSVVGMDFDFATLHIVGFALYTTFNVGLYYVPMIQVWFLFSVNSFEFEKYYSNLKFTRLCFSCDQDEYFQRFPRSLNPVQLSDVFFSCHATIASLIIIYQCFVYDVSIKSSSIPLIDPFSMSYRVYFVVVILESRSTNFKCYTINSRRICCYCHPVRGISSSQSYHVARCSIQLQLHQVINYAQIFATSKCTLYPFQVVHLIIQWNLIVLLHFLKVYMNCQRKSTAGWCIGTVFLDFVGGILSMLQMILDAYNHGNFYLLYNWCVLNSHHQFLVSF